MKTHLMAGQEGAYLCAGRNAKLLTVSDGACAKFELPTLLPQAALLDSSVKVNARARLSVGDLFVLTGTIAKEARSYS